ncbi:MAG: acetate--CoA ligase family protein [Acidimicrobiales bacterium]|jgi:acetyl-CoA synthetase (ADP-forming)|uniref:ATP-grasp domain-containing protein n=1 Tax=marine metagenome TaxID=408172 RepID=A0A381N349_9ZZZZ|nr:acetate--CoA ligase family protein [Acidimicrobiales bacterium]MEC9202953.1 acetate--CoA ligase family protein [Actinomycetota bacterium]MED5584360.1 acetate--CoA ligase family protein [Actinomycetota bacterium]|tara:strand:- start:2524 stop:3162 length:639 start_codon:yes stop_codon:yes gene_type:complete
MPTLSEADSRRLVEDAGVAVSPWTTASDAGSAAEAAEALGLPVVVKLCGDAIAHKTERGLVRLGLSSRDEAGAAAADLLAAARPEDGEVGLLVSTMVHGNRELIAGLVRDEQFGPCVMLGLGGILAEAVADVAFRLAPLEHGDALDLIDDLGAQSLLGEFRGEPAVDREALADTLMALSRIAADSDIRSVDLNPLIVVEGRPVAVDALVETA